MTTFDPAHGAPVSQTTGADPKSHPIQKLILFALME